MSKATIETKFDRKISVEGAGTRGVILTATDTERCNSGCKSVSAYLTKEEIRLLVGALEPYAEETKTSLELFDEMPLGAKFRLEGETTERVKISEGYYVILGEDSSIPKTYLECLKIAEED